jgi:hypothetical protein
MLTFFYLTYKILKKIKIFLANINRKEFYQISEEERENRDLDGDGVEQAGEVVAEEDLESIR